MAVSFVLCGADGPWGGGGVSTPGIFLDPNALDRHSTNV